ncbi:bifunctional glycosyltransferase/CDP-glycerol:glycerophosphate glycerophosphotransferase [Actinomadura alba]|uniref:bifunctional glycosyltransferase/CDP-glycerol:glycerophosphate glycerophosphotransferase n=1 Tax=Actinomadura alba TaxID=406431 RepID=UPI001C9D2F03|nr:bifunctional glycosyltransferase family 2 protein/CDP-glycerol:glycerophosphate glycerophosphotransferase [Actinomadura alba]
MSEILLSVIVPAYNVAGYLRECFDSVLAHQGDDIELITIDDRSPDGSGAIMDEYAASDPRVRVRHLEKNVGLGEARNIGLEMAQGEYVWFVDGDDWLPDGSIQAITRRLRETRPDMLGFDHSRVYWDGRVTRSAHRKVFKNLPESGVFTMRERPSVMDFLMIVCNKAIRREFLLDLGLRFGGGYYEDINVTYPVLMAAERITLLDRVCYFYRQRRRGSITKTVGERHFEVFPQYDKIFAFMDERGAEVDEFRKAMFNRMFWHLFIIFGHADRVHRRDRREFFNRMVEGHRKYRPAGYRPPGGVQGVRLRLVERGSYPLFVAFRRFNLVRVSLGKASAAVRRTPRRVVADAKARYRRLYYRIQCRLPMDQKLAVYSAYWNRGYACNPAAIHEKARELAPDVRGVWVVKKSGVKTLPPGVDHVVAGSLPYYRLMARAKYFVNNANFPNFLIKRPGAVHLQTMHGTPLKAMGLDQIKYPVAAKGTDFDDFLRRSDRWDYLISSNPLSSEAWQRAVPCDYELLEIGYPRNDRLVNATDQEVAGLRADLGIPEGSTAILYAPTHRDYQHGFEPMLDIGRVMTGLGPDHVLLLRAHYFYNVKDAAERYGWPADRIIDVSAHPTVEDLCLASDALITDYSSIMFDYANLDDRPIVIYANDWDTYRRTRGVYFDLPAAPPGAVATDENELIEVFRNRTAWDGEAAKHRAEFRRRYCPWDDGQAAERAVRRVFLGR